MVLGAGLEPARISPHAPQACVSANFTTRAGVKTSYNISNIPAECKHKFTGSGFPGNGLVAASMAGRTSPESPSESFFRPSGALSLPSRCFPRRQVVFFAPPGAVFRAARCCFSRRQAVFFAPPGAVFAKHRLAARKPPAGQRAFHSGGSGLAICLSLVFPGLKQKQAAKANIFALPPPILL